MSKKITKKIKRLPIIIEESEDNIFIAECPVFEGCYTQGETLSEVMENIREVIDMCLDEIKQINNYKLSIFHYVN